MSLITLPEAADLAVASLAEHFAGARFRLAALSPGATAKTAQVFRATGADPGSVIVKVFAAKAQWRGQATRLAQVYARMAHWRMTVPRPLSEDEARNSLIMEDAGPLSAEALWQQGGAAATRALEAAGTWINRYHALSLRRVPFNPDGHLRWLTRLLNQHRDGQRCIPDFSAIESAVVALHALAEGARGQPSLRCVTHGDYHLGNLHLRPQGRVFGFDLENVRPGDAMRDLANLLAQALRTSTAPVSESAMASAAAPLLNAYGTPPSAPEVSLFLQRLHGLTAWAALDESAAPLTPNRRRVLAIAQCMTHGAHLPWPVQPALH